jgi:hypothetical protein
MRTASPAYLEIIDFIAAGTTPEAVVHFQPSPEAHQILANLIEREKENLLSPEPGLAFRNPLGGLRCLCQRVRLDGSGQL